MFAVRKMKKNLPSISHSRYKSHKGPTRSNNFFQGISYQAIETKVTSNNKSKTVKWTGSWYNNQDSKLLKTSKPSTKLV